MINLAKKDIEHIFGKFIIIAMGVGMLFGVVLIMIGVYRGMVFDAEVLLDDIHADLWIVQQNTLGPFAESSRVHEDLKSIIGSIQGIDKSEAITFQNIQLPKKNKKIRVLAIGYDPYGQINPINKKRLIAGRSLKTDHYEMVVSKITGFKLRDKIKLGRHNYEVVGITKGSVSSGGDPVVYISLKDAQELQFLYSNKEIQNDRARGIVSKNSHMVNAIVATVKPGYVVAKIAKKIRIWQHKSVYTNKNEKYILTKNVIQRASKQIGMFTAILILVATIIIALIIYTMTLEKIKEISIMKLIGVPNFTIIKMIFQESILLGFLAFIFGNIFAHLIYTKFPKRVLLELPDAWILFLVITVASIIASLVGIRKVIKADPSMAIGG